jgi:hypothetical protein
MSRVAIDSNILIYAELEPGSAKGKRSADLILRAARNGVISAQALGEISAFRPETRPNRVRGGGPTVADLSERVSDFADD